MHIQVSEARNLIRKLTIIAIMYLEQFSNDEKPNPKQLLRPITTGAGSAMNQSQFLAITCNSLKVREKSCVHGAVGFGFDSHWLKNWRESFKPITKHSNRNHVITFDSHLKTALIVMIVHVNNGCANVHKVRIPLSLSGFIGMTMNFFSINILLF